MMQRYQTHIIFDLDGTIADTQNIHQQIESDFIKTFGFSISPQVIGIEYAGRSPQERIPELLKSKDISFNQSDIDNFVDKKDSIVIDLLNKGQIQLISHADEILKYLNNKDYKIGLASGACREFIDQFIKYFGFQDIIVASTSSNEVKNKKPHPDVFINSLNKLEKVYGKADTTYVIGDGRSDMEGGYKSGSQTVWLNYLNKKKLNHIYCKYEIKSLKDLKKIL